MLPSRGVRLCIKWRTKPHISCSTTSVLEKPFWLFLRKLLLKHRNEPAVVNTVIFFFFFNRQFSKASDAQNVVVYIPNCRQFKYGACDLIRVCRFCQKATKSWPNSRTYTKSPVISCSGTKREMVCTQSQFQWFKTSQRFPFSTRLRTITKEKETVMKTCVSTNLFYVSPGGRIFHLLS